VRGRVHTCEVGHWFGSPTSAVEVPTRINPLVVMAPNLLDAPPVRRPGDASEPLRHGSRGHPAGSGLVCRIRARRICAAPWVRETSRLSVILLPYIRESWSAMFKLLTVDLIEDPSPSGAGNADTLLMLTNAISPRVKHGSLPSLLKVCWPFERRPHVEQPAVAYRVKRAEVVHALTALIRPQEHIVVDR
jgi:hypothetical protein